MAWENGSIDDEEVVSSVDLGVQVDDGSALALEATSIIGTELSRSHPVVGTTASSILGDVVSGGLAWSWVDPGEVGDGGKRLLEVGNTGDGGGLVSVILEVWGDGSDHVEVGVDGDASTGGHTSSEVLRDGDVVVSLLSERSLNTGSPLELTNDTIRANNGIPDHGVWSWSSASKRTRAVVEVGVLVSGNWLVPSSVEVVWDNTGVLDEDISVGVIHNVVTNWEVDPVRLGDHLAAVGRGSNNVELVLWSNTGAEEDLGGTEDTSREDDTSTSLELVGSLVTRVVGWGNIDTSDGTSGTDDTINHGVCDELEIGPLLSGDEVGSQWSTTLSVNVHVRSVSEGAVLLLRNVVGSDSRPSSSRKTASEDVVRLLDVSLAISGWSISRRNARENSAGSSAHVASLPARWEVSVPIGRWWLEEETGVDSSATSEYATSHLVNIRAGDSNRVNPDLVAKTWDIVSGERSVGILQPLRRVPSTVSIGGWGTAFNEDDALSTLSNSVGS